MDIHIRFWDEFKCNTTTRYLTSEFPQSPVAKYLLEDLMEVVRPW